MIGEMKDYILIVTTCCFLANLTYLAYLENHASPIRSHKVKTSYDVLRLCEQICNRKNDSCFPPQSMILYYRGTNLDDMTFTQRFQPYVRDQDVSSIHRVFQSNKYQTRKYCPLQDIDPHYETLSKQNSCAIVGNGGIVLGSRCGRDIDSHDFVLRANFAHIKGYEIDVGNKTTMMMINDESLRDVYDTLIKKEKGKQNYDDMVQYLRDHLDGSILWFAKGTEAHGSAAKLQKIARFFSDKKLPPKLAYGLMTVEEAVSRIWKQFQYYPSSGFDMLAVAESLCQTITLYGFYPYDVDPSGRKVLHHYYEPTLENFSTDNHNFNEEHTILKEMDRKGLLRLIYDPC